MKEVFVGEGIRGPWELLPSKGYQLIVFYHSPCVDGAMSCAILKKELKLFDVVYKPLPHPFLLSHLKAALNDIVDSNTVIWFVDASPLSFPDIKSEDTKEITKQKHKEHLTTFQEYMSVVKRWYVFDHHASTMKVIAQYPQIQSHFLVDMNLCSATLLWHMFQKSEPPYMLRIIESRDNRGCTDDEEAKIMTEYIYSAMGSNIDYSTLIYSITGPEHPIALDLRTKGESMVLANKKQAHLHLQSGHVALIPSKYHIETTFNNKIESKTHDAVESKKEGENYALYLTDVHHSLFITVQDIYRDHKEDFKFGKQIDIIIFYTTQTRKSHENFSIQLRNAVENQYNLNQFAVNIRQNHPLCISGGGHPNASGCQFKADALDTHTKTFRL